MAPKALTQSNLWLISFTCPPSSLISKFPIQNLLKQKPFNASPAGMDLGFQFTGQ